MEGDGRDGPEVDQSRLELPERCLQEEKTGKKISSVVQYIYRRFRYLRERVEMNY